MIHQCMFWFTLKLAVSQRKRTWSKILDISWCSYCIVFILPGQQWRDKNMTQHRQMKSRSANMDQTRRSQSSLIWKSFFFLANQLFTSSERKQPWSLLLSHGQFEGTCCFLLSLTWDQQQAEPVSPSRADDLCPGMRNGMTATAPFNRHIHLLACVFTVYKSAVDY